ncbi:MAG: hypothetical protein WC861_02465 [Candidatus Micrarchaeia archaeon]|jgi:hypothetical protein
MDDVILLVAAACASLSVLVYLMWRAATKAEWGDFARKEKAEWRAQEQKRKGAGERK